ncbi:class I SAM-dependent methyltransferase [Metabacillus fastidiosus]|uniref:class I SAM-dependent methyltransferase n=1 Tax=Metabacillus fastidiosus TaxID=1458 RepID=UPI003D29EFCB
MGREFLDVFDKWASYYDDTVTGADDEYREVFKNYPSILEQVASLAYGSVLEFGTGTGNLTEKLIKKGYKVTGIEPSAAMRKIALKKLKGKATILDGDFLNFRVSYSFNSIVSTYAFHHLTDKEKAEAVALYGKLLKRGGKIVLADTMYPTNKEYTQAIEDAKAAGFLNLAKDLQTEFYTTIPYLQEIFTGNKFSAVFQRCNDFVWIINAVKTE